MQKRGIFIELPGTLWETDELTLIFFLIIYFLTKITQNVHLQSLL